ncbi:MAG: hypothetical protein RL154_1414 [Pseudomonadota bacterium]
MEEFKPVEWDSSFEIGVEKIDEQHKTLVGILNEAGTKLGTNDDLPTLIKIVDELLSYTLYHFETEEHLMNQYDYASKDLEHSLKHIEQHRAFSSKILNIKRDMQNGNVITKDELLAYLKDWLTNHILYTDKKLGEYINQAK